jgi:hypothetical protein
MIMSMSLACLNDDRVSGPRGLIFARFSGEFDQAAGKVALS